MGIHLMPPLFLMTQGTVTSIEVLRPNGKGDQEGISDQYPASGDHFDKVDDIIADDNSTYIQEKISNGAVYDDYLHDSLSRLNASITQIVLTTRGKRENSVGFVGAIHGGFKIGGVRHTHAFTLAEIAPDGNWHTATHTWTTSPATGNPWTTAEVNAMQLVQGLSKGFVAAAYGYSTQLFIEVYLSYTP